MACALCASAAALAALPPTAAPTRSAHPVLLPPHHVDASAVPLVKPRGYVFGAAGSVENLFDDADGCGLKLFVLLRDRATKASPRDKALIAATHARIVREGGSGRGDEHDHAAATPRPARAPQQCQQRGRVAAGALRGGTRRCPVGPHGINQPRFPALPRRCG